MHQIMETLVTLVTMTNHVFWLPFQKESTTYFHFYVFGFLQVLCTMYMNLPEFALFMPKIQMDGWALFISLKSTFLNKITVLKMIEKIYLYHS